MIRKEKEMSIMSDFRNWRKYRHSVDQLNRLSESTLKDIGIERGDIARQVRRAMDK